MGLKLRRCLRSMLCAVAGLAAGGSLFFATAPDAHAAFVLDLSNGTSTAAVVDGGVGDIDKDAGEIKYSGSIGIFFINLTTGRSKPTLGSAGLPEMELKSVDVSSSRVGGTLTIRLTDTDFTAKGLTNWITSISGGSSGSLSFEAYVGTDNKEFSTDIAVANYNSLTGLFTETVSSQVLINAPPFSVTLVATIKHGAGLRATGFSALVSDPVPLPVPEPGALVLFGTGLLGLGLLARRWPKGRRRGHRLH